MRPIARRIQNELRKCAKGPVPFTIAVDDADFHKVSATLSGPPGTPHEDGTLLLRLSLPLDYPFMRPEIEFVTKIWHPKVNAEAIGPWAPAKTLKDLIRAVYALTECPDWDNSAAMRPIVDQHRNDAAEFEQQARVWTMQYPS
jgi:ubiquitin-protein ligase